MSTRNDPDADFDAAFLFAYRVPDLQREIEKFAAILAIGDVTFSRRDGATISHSLYGAIERILRVDQNQQAVMEMAEEFTRQLRLSGWYRLP